MLGRLVTIFVIAVTSSCGNGDQTNYRHHSPHHLNFHLNALPNAKQITFHVENCMSGLTTQSQTNRSNGTFLVYTDDQDCLVKISSFFIKKKEYLLQGNRQDVAFFANEQLPAGPI